MQQHSHRLPPFLLYNSPPHVHGNKGISGQLCLDYWTSTAMFPLLSCSGKGWNINPTLFNAGLSRLNSQHGQDHLIAATQTANQNTSDTHRILIGYSSREMNLQSCGIIVQTPKHSTNTFQSLRRKELDVIIWVRLHQFRQAWTNL